MMTSSFKKILMAGTALVAMGCSVQAQADTVVVDSFVVGVSTDPNAEPAISYQSGGTWASIDDGVNVTGNIVTYQNGVGNLAVQGTTTINGNIGESGKGIALLWTGINPAATDIYNGDVYADTIALDAGVSIFNGTVSSGHLYFAGAGTVTFNGNVDADMDYANHDGSVTIGDDVTFGGSINSGASGGSGVGTLTLAGSAAIQGDVSYQDDGLALLQAGANGSTSVIAGDANAEMVVITGTGSLTLEGKLISHDIVFDDDGSLTLSYGQTVSGNVSSTDGVAGDGVGTLSFDGADGDTATLQGSISAGLKSLVLNGEGSTASITGNVMSADTVTLNGNTLSISGTFTVSDGQTIDTTLISATKGNVTGGSVIADGAVTISADSLLHVTVGPNAGMLKVGDTFTVVDGSNSGSGGVEQLMASNITSGLLYTFAQTSDEDSLEIELTEIKAMSDIATAGNNAAVAAAASAFCGDSGANCNTFYNNLMGAADAQTFNSLLESAQPANLNGAAVTSMVDAGAAVFSVMEGKLAAARAGDTDGMAAGYMPSGSSFWAQGYGQTSHQGLRSGIAGYQADLLGFAVGAELPKMSNGSTLGIALNYANTDADGRNANTTATDIDSYGVALYGSYAAGNGMFVDGQIGYAYNDIQTVRHNAGGAGLTANGDFSSDQYAARLRAGKDYAQKGGLYLTPSVMASYTGLSTGGYTETGTGTLLSVNDENFDIFKLGVGLQAEWRLVGAAGEKVKPSLHANYAYNVTGDNVETSASFVGGGPVFKTTGANPARSEFNAGVGLTYTTQANFDLTGVYDYTYKQDYASHAGLLRGTVHF